MLKKSIILSAISLILSCENDNKITIKQMDSFIERYDKVSFSELKGAFVHVRQRTFVSNIYILGKTGEDVPIYFITYNFILGKITEMNKSDFTKEKVPEYYSESEIKQIIDDFRKYDFSLLGIDKDEDVFLNPFEDNTGVFFLRVKHFKNRKFIRKNNYVFKHYKGNWYFNVTY